MAHALVDSYGNELVFPLSQDMESISLGDPAAGAEISYTASVPVVILALAVTFVTDANVANRTPMLELDDGTNTCFRATQNAALTATSTTKLAWYAGITAIGAVGGNAMGGLPTGGVLLKANWRLRTVTTSLQVGDNYGPAYAYGYKLA